MRLYDGRIYGQILQLSLEAEYTEDVIEDPVIDPSAEAAVYGLPWAIAFREVTPWGTAARYPYHRVDHSPVIF